MTAADSFGLGAPPTPFGLDGVPALSRSTADRQESLRTDPERLRAGWASAWVLRVDSRGRVPVPEGTVTGGGSMPLSLVPAADVAVEPPGNAVFLGRWESIDYWAVPGDPGPDAATAKLDSGWGAPLEVPVVAGEAWVELRAHGAGLDDLGAGLLTTAVALRNWQHRARYCARCGGPTRLRQAGWATTCERCGREEYPRTDPAAICLVHDDVGVNGERVLLARQPGWAPRRYSVLAGFVEAGESLEGCVEREIREEVGVDVYGIRYLGSQPWPFPRSIMLGFAARASVDAPLRPADGEIEHAFWAERERVRAALDGTDPELLPPGGSSIARLMLESWAQARS